MFTNFEKGVTMIMDSLSTNNVSSSMLANYSWLHEWYWFWISMFVIVVCLAVIVFYEISRRAWKARYEHEYDMRSDLYSDYQAMKSEVKRLQEKVDRVSNRKRGTDGRFVKKQ